MSEISVYILKPFPYSLNGVKEEYAEAGKTLPIPDRLFDGLNKEGYVRRAVIGDGRVSLRPDVSREVDKLEATFTEVIEVALAPGGEIDRSLSELRATMDSGVAVARPAPRPPVKTSELTEVEEAAVTDGSWKNLKFFAKRSIAAKVSDQPIKDGPDADAAIEAYIAVQKA